MDKPILSINKKDIPHTLGMEYIIGAIEKSGLFEIKTHNDTINTCRGYRALLLYLNDKKIYMDFWEYPTPTYTMDVIKANFDLIIKLQQKRMTYEQFEAACRRKGFLVEATPEEKRTLLGKIVPFTFFPSKMMEPYIGKEDSIPTEPIDKIGFFCGKSWKCRGPMQQKLKNDNIEYIISDKRFGKIIPDEDYLKKMKSSKFGICLAGRGSMLTEAKNRREIDYMMLKKPLLLNYHPYYYNEIEPGKHFILINDKTDFTKLESLYNIEEITKNANQWYRDNATPDGVVKVFMQILNDRKLL